MNQEQVTVVNSDSIEVEVSSPKRNYSFLHKKDESLDAVEDGNVQFVVPAQPGSCYWAILKIGYENHDRPISMNDFVDSVDSLMEERDPAKWKKFKNKKKVKTLKNDVVVEKNANNWRERVETNIKTMTRHGGSNPYGNRLRERGHILRWEPEHFDGNGGYVLRTTTNEPLKKGKKNIKGNVDILSNIDVTRV